MKIFPLCLLLLIVTSCSQPDDHTPSQEPLTQTQLYRTAENPAGNSANPFDLAGQVHDELFVSYFSQPALFFDINGVATKVESLAAANTHFGSLAGAASTRTTATRTQAWIGHETCAATDAVSTASLGQSAKNSMSQFINTLLSMNRTVSDFDSFYTFIESYEAGVLSNPTFTAYEKERLLTMSSICRYSTYRGKKKPKKNTDPEWDHIVFSIAGGIDGGERSAAESVVDALTAGIVQNQKP